MPDQVHEPTTRPLDELAASDPGGSAQAADAEEIFPDCRYGEFIDWLTIDPATIEGEKGPIEELRFSRENFEDLLRSHKGQYVLIVGREIIAYFEDFESATLASPASVIGEPLR